jgi:ribosomal protein S18 acetylase RimI-like enzyme
MTETEFVSWLPSARDGYANDMVRNAGADASAARVKAERDTERLFPGGKPSAEQLVFVIEADGAPVGELWLSERAGDFRPVLWVYDVHIAEEHRGRGFGRAAMEFAEHEARRRGLSHVALNVFGGNEPARNLYRSLGYTENAISMNKAIS